MFWPSEVSEDDGIDDDELSRARLVMLAFTAVAIVLAIVFYLLSGADAFPEVEVASAVLTIDARGAKPVRRVERRDAARVHLVVALRHAPVGRRLMLDCCWLDPAGKTTALSRFRTAEINAPHWNIDVRQPLPAGAVPGKWSVRLSLADRPLCELPLEVVDFLP